MPRPSQIPHRVKSLDRARSFWRDTAPVAEPQAFAGLAFFALGGTRLMLRETATRGKAFIRCLAIRDVPENRSGLTRRGPG